MRPSEVHAATKRALAARLAVKRDGRIVPNTSRREEFVVHGVQYAFVPDRGGLSMGVPTSCASAPLDRNFARNDEPPPVWPDPEGPARGIAAKKAAELSAGIGLEQLLEDIRTRYAVERALEIIGEAARRVSQETRQAHPEIPWAGIIGFRNVLAHDEYGAIDYRRLYTVVRDGIPELVTTLEDILALLEKDG